MANLLVGKWEICKKVYKVADLQVSKRQVFEFEKSLNCEFLKQQVCFFIKWQICYFISGKSVSSKVANLGFFKVVNIALQFFIL